MDLREVFATNLRRLRHEKGLSQDDLAYEAKVSRSYLAATPNCVSPLRAGKSKRTRTLLKPSIAAPAATVTRP